MLFQLFFIQQCTMNRFFITSKLFDTNYLSKNIFSYYKHYLFKLLLDCIKKITNFGTSLCSNYTMKKIFLLLVFLMVASLQDIIARPYIFKNVSTKDGLFDQIVSTIHKDKMGLVWIGSASSVECFDGTNIKHFKVPGENSARRRVSALLATELPELWMGNGDGLWYLDNDKEEFVKYDDSKIPFGVSDLKERDENLYISTVRGLFIKNGDDVTRVLINQNELAPSNILYEMTFDDEGNIWLASEGGIHCYNIETGNIQTYTTIECSNFWCIEYLNGKVFAGSLEHGLFSFDIATEEFLSMPRIDCSVIRALDKLDEKVLCVGTDGTGLHLIDTYSGEIRHISKNDHGGLGLSSNAIYSLCSQDDQIFVGFYQDGFDYSLAQTEELSLYSFEHFTTQGMAVRALGIHGTERLIGSREGLFFIDEADGRIEEFGPNKLHSQMIFSICYYQEEYYVGTFGGGMYIFNSKNMELRPFDPDSSHPLKDRTIYNITEDKDGYLWIGTEKGVYRYKDGKEQVACFTSSNSVLPRGSVYEIYFDSTGRGWICTEAGIAVWDKFSNSIRNDIFPSNFFNKEKIRVVYEDSRHNLYFVPDLGAVWISDMSLQNFQKVPETSPLNHNTATCIIEDSSHNIWIGSKSGLYQYNGISEYELYDFYRGLPSMSFSLCEPIIDENGRVWFGNDNGLIYKDTNDDAKQNIKDYSPRITDIIINGDPLFLKSDELLAKETIKISGKPAILTFSLSDFSYTDPDCMSFEYKMDGIDEDWQKISGKAQISYYNISWGNYKFHLRRSRDLEKEVIYTFSIPISAMDIFMYIGIGALALFGIWILWWFYIHMHHVVRLYHLLKAMGNNRRLNKLAKEAEQAEVEAEEEEKIRKHKAIVEEELPPIEKYKTFNMSQENRERLILGLSRLMTEEKLFTRQDLKASDVADALDTTPFALSYLFNQVLHINYNDYINEHRVAEFKRLVRKPENSRYTLTALAERCGFSSRASFFRYFKKATGITPNEYIRSLEVSKS